MIDGVALAPQMVGEPGVEEMLRACAAPPAAARGVEGHQQKSDVQGIGMHWRSTAVSIGPG